MFRSAMLLAFAVWLVLLIGVIVMAPLHAQGPDDSQAPVQTDFTSAYMTHGPVVGNVDSDSATIWARTDVSAPVQAKACTNAALTQNCVSSQVITTTSDSDFTAHLDLNGLSAQTLYYYTILVDNVSQFAVLASPRFKTFPVENTQVDFTFGYLTDFCCFNGAVDRRPTVATFRKVSQETPGPGWVMLGGDMDHGNPGAATATPPGTGRATVTSAPTAQANARAMFQRAYERNGTNNANFVDLILRNYAVVHQWDDHDFCCNNAIGTYPFKETARDVFEEYFPVYDLPDSDLGIYHSFRYAQAEFFVLDTRYNRYPEAAPQGELLGPDQMTWLEEGLLAAQEDENITWKFILTSSVWNTTIEKDDAWYAFRDGERQDLLEYIGDNGITNVILLSGDIHMGGIDNGENADLPEMVVPSANLYSPTGEEQEPTGQGGEERCLTTENNARGTWSEGVYPGTATPIPINGCPGYGVITVTDGNSPHVYLKVKDMDGNAQVEGVIGP